MGDDDGTRVLREQWDWLVRVARSDDDAVRSKPSWVPGGGLGREVQGSISYDTNGPGGSAVFRVWCGCWPSPNRSSDPELALVCGFVSA